MPFRVRVGRVRWLIGLLVFAGGAALLVFALFFDTAGTTPMGAVVKALMWIGLPVAVACLPVHVMGALVPRHLTMSQEGVCTWAWQLDWLQGGAGRVLRARGGALGACLLPGVAAAVGVGTAHGFGPVVEGRRAVAPNVPARQEKSA